MLDERQCFPYFSRESMHNYPEGYEKKPWCPHTKLINTCALLVGIELSPENFCTEEVTNTTYTGMGHFLSSADFHPKASCVSLNSELEKLLLLAKEKVTLTPEINIRLELLKTIDNLEEQKKTVEKYLEERRKYSERYKIIERWKNVIDDRKQELSEDEIIDKVEEFQKSLQLVIRYEKGTIGFLFGEVKNCPQAPKSRHVGPYS